MIVDAMTLLANRTVYRGPVQRVPHDPKAVVISSSPRARSPRVSSSPATSGSVVEAGRPGQPEAR